MLGLFREREVKTAITSNGFSLAMLTDEELSGFHSVELSFDFPTKEEMDEFRGEGAWEMAIGSLGALPAAGHPDLRGGGDDSTNYDRMGEVARFAFGLGCDLRVNVYQPVTGEEFTLSYDEFWQGFANLFAAGPVVVCSEPLVNAVMGLQTTRGNPCGQRSIRALPAGTISPCPYWPPRPAVSRTSPTPTGIWDQREFEKSRHLPQACDLPIRRELRRGLREPPRAA